MKKKVLVSCVALIFLVIVGALLLIDKSRNNKDLPSEHFVLEEGELPEQYIPSEYGSVIIEQSSAEKIQRMYGITAIYDGFNSIKENRVYSEEVYMYAKAMGTFIADDTKGVKLNKGDSIIFSFRGKSPENSGLSVGFVKDGTVSTLAACEKAEIGEEVQYQKAIEIEEDGVYYPYIVNISDISEYISDFNIAFINNESEE